MPHTHTPWGFNSEGATYKEEGMGREEEGKISQRPQGYTSELSQLRWRLFQEHEGMVAC